MHDTAAELTRAMARGDRAAVEAFYRRYFDWMYAAARACTKRDEAFCLDVVHDAVVRVVRVIKPMDSTAHLEGWLRVVIRTCALDRMRSDQRRVRREQASDARESTPATSDLDAAELLAAVLAKLDPQLVRLIELRYAEGLTLAKLATLFNSTTGAIDGRLRRAIAAIRQNWSDDVAR
jgi:RNA polymerase sigma-70 factor (ECF subfamily)